MGVIITCSVHGKLSLENTRVWNSRVQKSALRCKFCDRDFEVKRRDEKRRIKKKEMLENEVAHINNLPNIDRNEIEGKYVQIKLTKLFSKYNRRK